MTETAWVRVATPTIEEGRVTTVVAGRAGRLPRAPRWRRVVRPRQPLSPPGRSARRRPARGRLPDLPVARLPVRPDHRHAAARASGTRPSPYPVRPSRRRRRAGDRAARARRARRASWTRWSDTLTDWGLEACFGMVGHSNLGMADALRRADRGRPPHLRRHPPRGRGRLRRVGLRQAHRPARRRASRSPARAPPTS